MPQRISMSEMEPISSSSSSPPWLVLSLVAYHIDPKTLTIASSMCKSWYVCMSSNHLWEPICASLYPSLSNLHTSNPTMPYRRLFTLGYTAQKRRLQKPTKPQLSLHDIMFVIDIYNGSSYCLSTIVKAGDELDVDSDSLFRFNIYYDLGNLVVVEDMDDLRITWNVLSKGFESVFTIIDCQGNGSVVLGLEGWFSKELPPSGCCSGVGSASGLPTDLRLGLRESGDDGVGSKRAMVEKISVGVMNTVSWRYARIDDTLRYLQHFLLTS